MDPADLEKAAQGQLDVRRHSSAVVAVGPAEGAASFKDLSQYLRRVVRLFAYAFLVCVSVLLVLNDAQKVSSVFSRNRPVG